MAKVSLRSYNREIETMVDQGQLEEAIAHCRHILNAFPKNLDTYRLLGKAYLEARRYEEATDVFQRLLMAVPDDFVAHVGMSIIRDEQNELDEAIWHMQRAFEVQPSNAAIQGELQRLFGRRDGVEPPKIRLTRGALSHMYMQGELYPQAISEIKAVLDEDRERQDMQVLLARAYFHASQKNEAAEVCSQLLKRYPYCFDANRVLVELLPETERGESTQVYRRRVNELDPYATFTTGSIFHSEEVPDAAVSLERLDWSGQSVDLGQEWRESRGIGLGEEAAPAEEEPDWLKNAFASGSFSAALPTEEPRSAGGGNDEIPDFLREAGWGKDTGTFKEGPGTFEASEDAPEGEELAEGELPDWIKAMAPTGMNLPGSAPQPDQEEDLTDDNVPDWLQGLGNVQDSSLEEQQPLEEGDLPDWLAGLQPGGEVPQASLSEEAELGETTGEISPQSQPREETAPELAGEEEIPDWLATLQPGGTEAQEAQAEDETIAELASQEDLPDWIAAIKPGEEESQEFKSQVEGAVGSAGEEALPDWLASLGSVSETPHEEEEKINLPGEPALEATPEEAGLAEPTAEEELPEWIVALKPEDEESQETAPEEAGLAELASEAELPDWIAAMKPGSETFQEPQTEEAPIMEPAEGEDLPEWLRSVQAGQETPTEASQEPLQELPEMSTDSLSDWQIGEEEAAGRVDFDATDTGALGKSVDEQDDAIAWLESLAAKHGAKPEELVTKPEERTETEPEWIRQARAFKEGETVETAPVPEQPQAEPAEDLPEFIAKMQVEPVEPQETGGTPVDSGAHPPSVEEQDDAIAWLESLAAKHGAKPEELVTDPEARKETAPEWVQRAAQAEPTPEQAEQPEESVESLPDWIETAKEETGAISPELEDTQPQRPVRPTPVDETGVWLRELSEEELTAEAESVQPTMDKDVPDWLREIEAEASKTEAGSTTEKESEVPGWLEEIEAESAMDEGISSGEAGQEVPDWLSELSQTEAEPSTSEASPASSSGLEEVPDWLQGLEAEPAAAEQFPVFSPEEETPREPGDASEVRAFEAQPDSDETLTDWFKSLEEPAEHGTQAKEPVTEGAALEDLPSWLAGLEETPAKAKGARGAEDDLPEWLRPVDEQEPYQAERTAPTDWQPAEFAAPVQEEPSEPAGAPEAQVEEPAAQAAPEPEAEPETELEPAIEPAAGRRPGATGALSPAQDPALIQAQSELERGNISSALNGYEKLIRKGKMLDEIIHDLREALYRYPVDISILQALGDAYMRANRLQDALDSYTKAEELLR